LYDPAAGNSFRWCVMPFCSDGWPDRRFSSWRSPCSRSRRPRTLDSPEP
jgi:hypothetical protein